MSALTDAINTVLARQPKSESNLPVVAVVSGSPRFLGLARSHEEAADYAVLARIASTRTSITRLLDTGRRFYAIRP